MAKLLIEKSAENFIASRILFTSPNNYYCSSAHSIYYSLFQILKHLILYKYNLSESEIIERRRDVSGRLRSEHEFTIEFVRKRLHDNNDRFLARDVQTIVGELKELRTQADYLEIEVSYNKVKAAYEKADILHSKLKTKFNLT